MKVLVADKFEKSGIEGLKAAGCEVIFEPDLKDATLTEAIAKTGADVLVVRSTRRSCRGICSSRCSASGTRAPTSGSTSWAASAAPASWSAW